ncbi:MAG: hypothetical protein AAGI68_07660 [Planctomycetota bacterium]
MAQKSAWSLLDQAVLSGGRFALTVLVGRLAGADELGLYAMGFAVVMIGQVGQESLLCTPYTVLGNQVSAGRRRRALGATLTGWLGVIVLAAVGLWVAAGVFWAVGEPRWAGLLAWLALAGPGVLVHGMARRVLYAHLRVRGALVLDGVVSGLQVAAVVVLAGVGALGAESALGALGAAGLLGGLGWWVLGGECVVWDRRAVRPWLRRAWRFGRWGLGSQQARALGVMGVTWGLAAAAGTEAAGRYAAAALVVVAANPLLLGLGGVLEPKTAVAWKQGGEAELRRVVRKVTLGVGVVIGGYAVLAGLVGGAVLVWVLGDAGYAGLGEAVAVLAAGVAVRAVRIGWNSAIKAAGRPAWSFWAGVIELAVLGGAVGLLATGVAGGLSVEGAAYAVLAGSVVGSGVRWYAYRRVVGE